MTPRSDLQTAYLLVVPLFHVTGALATMVPSYASGGKLVLMPPGKFDADEAMRVIEREQVTNIGGVPTVMWRIVEAESFDQYDLTSVSRIGYGGAPAAPELVERIRVAFPQVKETLEPLIAQKVARILVDFSAVTYIDSSGLATLIETLQRIQGYGGKFAMFGLRDSVRGIFEIARLDQIFSIFPTEAAAVAGL